jgi:ribonuclease H / adenosylcobalamin/alpha-ribazole phosphatase
LPVTRLLLIRHGETPLNREMRYIGLRDDGLTETGKLQARQLADALATFPIAAIYSSPLQRAYLTAQAIAERHDLEVLRNNALIESNFGQWEGLTAKEAKARGAKDAEILRAWQDDPTLAPPQGESLEAMSKRVLAAVTAIVQEHPGQTIVLVTHTGPLKAILCAALGVSMITAFRIFLDPATISVVDWQEPRPVIRLINSHTHLGWDQARWL